MDYAGLQSAVATWINRTDLTAVLPTLITLAEDRIFLGSDDLGVEPLRVSDMLTTIGTYAATFANPLPSTWTEVKRVSWFRDASMKYPLDFLPLESIGVYEGLSSRPQYFSIKGDNIIFGPTFSNPVEVLYYARPAPMVASTDQNFLLAGAPSVYLQATLLEAAIYVKDEAAAQGYAQAWKNAQRSYQKQDDGNMHSGATLRMRSDSRRTP